MKKIWQNNSYTILLIATSLILTLIVASGLEFDDEKYITITVQSGETLWKMAEDYSEDHNLSKTEFVAWVEKKNGVSNGKIYAGDELILPVSPTSSESPQYAGIEIE